MFANASPSDSAKPRPAAVPAYVRARSEIRARFERAGSATRLVDCFETGGMRLRLPNSETGCDAVLINTAGGLTGGDEARLSCAVGAKARVRITTQSAEKIYRTEQGPAFVSAAHSLDEGAQLSVDMALSASLLLCEMTVLGRVARNERMTSGSFRDRWRVRRAGTLVFAEDVRLDGDISGTMQRAAVGSGAAAIATLLYVAPVAESRLESLRNVLASAKSNCGASAWNGMLVARFAARDPTDVRRDVAGALRRLSRAELPRIWAV
jgi:urease accessory protein